MMPISCRSLAVINNTLSIVSQPKIKKGLVLKITNFKQELYAQVGGAHEDENLFYYCC